jgi:hypothetical protein
MNKQLQADLAEMSSVGSNPEMDRLAIGSLLARNERLMAALGSLVDSITTDTAGKEVSEQLTEDLAIANRILDEFETHRIY